MSAVANKLRSFTHEQLLETLKEVLTDRPEALKELCDWAQPWSAPSNGGGYHGKGGYGKEGYGKGYYGKDGYGKDGYGKDGYGKDGYGKDGWGKDGYGKGGYGKDGCGEWGGPWDPYGAWGPPPSYWGPPPSHWEEVSAVPGDPGWKGKGKGPDYSKGSHHEKTITGRTTRTLNPEGPPPVSKVEIAGVTDGTRYNGMVKRFTPGKFGFIETNADDLGDLGDNYKDVYVHWNQLGQFSVGDEVSFEVVVNEKGGVKAVNLGLPGERASKKRAKLDRRDL